jgi:sugar lactone lactonase YvrE
MPESPRWHDGRLWLSDMGAREVVAVDLDGRIEVVARVPTGLTGIGFLPDGRLVLDTTIDGALLRLEPDGSLAPYADLTGLADPPWSDLIVDGRGNAYVGNLGFDFLAGAPPAPGFLALVTPDGSARRVADDLAFPNGIAVTPDNATLIVAESYGARLTAFAIGADGSLTDRRSGRLPGAYPDGICIDAGAPSGSPRCPAGAASGSGKAASARVGRLDRGCFACRRRTGWTDAVPAAADWSGCPGWSTAAGTGGPDDRAGSRRGLA